MSVSVLVSLCLPLSLSLFLFLSVSLPVSVFLCGCVSVCVLRLCVSVSLALSLCICLSMSLSLCVSLRVFACVFRRCPCRDSLKGQPTGNSSLPACRVPVFHMPKQRVQTAYQTQKRGAQRTWNLKAAGQAVGFGEILHMSHNQNPELRWSTHNYVN